MAEPLREQILARVATNLDAITEGGTVGSHTYWSTPTVVRDPVSITHYTAELDAGPVFGVVRGSGSRLDVQSLADDSGARTWVDTYRFIIHCYEQKRGETLAGTALERSWEDHIQCLLADRFLGGLVDDLRPEESETDDGELEPQAWFRQGWVAEVVRDL